MKKKKKSKKSVVIILLLLIAIAVCCFLFMRGKFKPSSEENLGTNNTSQPTDLNIPIDIPEEIPENELQGSVSINGMKGLFTEGLVLQKKDSGGYDIRTRIYNYLDTENERSRLTITLKNESGDVILNTGASVAQIKPGESVPVKISTDEDISKAYYYTITKK